MGGIAVVANLEGLPAGGLRLSGPLLADIFLGKIKRWSDPAIKESNPDVALPDLAINVVHRQDGSGSTYDSSRSSCRQPARNGRRSWAPTR